MPSQKEVLDIWAKVLGSLQSRTGIRYAVIGNGIGDVEVTDKPGFVWVRYEDEQSRLSYVRCFLGYMEEGTRVVIGKLRPEDDFEQVLGIDWGPYALDMTDYQYAFHKVPRHGDTHHGTYGSDPAYIDYSNLAMGRVAPTDPASMNVAVYSFVYGYGTEVKDYDGETLDLSGEVPGSGHKYLLVYFDTTTESIDYTSGTTVPIPMNPPMPTLEDVSAIPLAIVEMYQGQTSITIDDTWQRKLILGSIGGAVPPHTHTADDSGGSSLIGIQELMLNCATNLPMIGNAIWPTDVYHELYVQDTDMYISGDVVASDLVWIHPDPTWGCGQIIFLRPAEPSMYVDYRITLRHGIGNIRLYGERDLVLEDRDDHVFLIYNGENWCDLAHHLSIFGKMLDGNYSEFEEDGAYVAHGTARVWVTEDLTPSNVGKPSANPPAVGEYQGFAFDRYDRATEEQVYVIWHVPDGFATGDGSVRGHFGFFVENPPAATGDEAVVMGFEYKRIAPGGVFDFSAGTSSGTITTTITDGEAAYTWHETANGTVVTTGWAVGDVIMFRFYRDATNIADTYDNEAVAADNDVWVGQYHLEYLADKLGGAS